jgi:hypothetical protein
MTQDEIIEIARQVYGECVWHESSLLRLEAFVKLVEDKEREACAKVADEYATWGGSNFYDWFKKLAAAIRARGEA